jgi:hypothetical protein
MGTSPEDQERIRAALVARGCAIEGCTNTAACFGGAFADFGPETVACPTHCGAVHQYCLVIATTKVLTMSDQEAWRIMSKNG